MLARLGGMSVCLELQVNGAEEPEAKRSRLEVEALRVKRLTEHAVLPRRGSPHAAGYDLYRCHYVLAPCHAGIYYLALSPAPPPPPPVQFG